MGKLFFTRHGCFDIDSIVCIKYVQREALYEVSFKNTTDHFWLNEEQYECLQNDLEDICDDCWYADCDFEFDEDTDEVNESVDKEDKYKKYELNVQDYLK